MPYPYPTHQRRVLGPRGTPGMVHREKHQVPAFQGGSSGPGLEMSLPGRPVPGIKKKAGISETPAFGHAPEGSY